jgi:hypothetical protein
MPGQIMRLQDVVMHERRHAMTPRENLMAVLSGGEPEWMPVCMHIANANNLPGHLPAELVAPHLDRLKVTQFVGGDILYEIYAARRNVRGKVESRTETRGDGRVTTIATAEGSITEEVVSATVPTPVYDPLPDGHVLPGPIVNSVHKSFFVKAPSDYLVLRSCFEAQRYEIDHDLVLRERARVGDQGICVLGGGPSSPLYSLVAQYAGLEQFSFDLFDEPAEVEATMQVMTEAACRWYRAAAASPCEVIRCTEDLDTKLVSPEWFRRYAVPALTQYCRICHDAGKLFIIHMCGPIRDFLPDIKATGADAIHCLTPPPMGNTTVADERAVLAGHVAAMWRMDANLMLHGSIDDIDRAVSELRVVLGDWRKALIIIPCGRAPLVNLRRVIDQGRIHVA